jgi:hypothetical protein
MRLKTVKSDIETTALTTGVKKYARHIHVLYQSVASFPRGEINCLVVSAAVGATAVDELGEKISVVKPAWVLNFPLFEFLPCPHATGLAATRVELTCIFRRLQINLKGRGEVAN